MAKKRSAGEQDVDFASLPGAFAESVSRLKGAAGGGPNQQVTLIALVSMVLAGFALWVVYSLASG